MPYFDVRLGRLAYRGQGQDGSPIFEQKEVDILMAIDIVKLSFRRVIQQAVLVTGDSDFAPAIQLAREEGVQVLVAHGGRIHNELLTYIDKEIKIDQDFIDSIPYTR